MEVEAKLIVLAEGRIEDRDPATVLQEQDEIEFALGENYLERRGEE